MDSVRDSATMVEQSFKLETKKEEPKEESSESEEEVEAEDLNPVLGGRSIFTCTHLFLSFMWFFKKVFSLYLFFCV